MKDFSENFIFCIPFLCALLFSIVKYFFFYEENNFNDIVIETILLTIINYLGFYILYENFNQIKKIQNVQKNIKESPIITGFPNFFPYQKVNSM